MKHFAEPRPGVHYLATSSAEHLDRLHDRLQSELQHHLRRTPILQDGPEPCVELSLDEARITIANLSKIAHLLRMVAEGAL